MIGRSCFTRWIKTKPIWSPYLTGPVSYGHRTSSSLARALYLGSSESTSLCDGSATFSANQLWAQAFACAAELRALGVEKGDRVAVQVHKSLNVLPLYLGSLCAGAMYLPLNTAYTQAELRYLLQDAKPRVVVTDGQVESTDEEMTTIQSQKLYSSMREKAGTANEDICQMADVFDGGSPGCSYRADILKQLTEQGSKTRHFHDVFQAYALLIEENTDLRNQIERLKVEATNSIATAGDSGAAAGIAVEALRTENVKLKEEVTELYRRRSEHTTELLDAKNKLQTKDGDIATLRTHMSRLEMELRSLKEQNVRLQDSNSDVEKANQLLNDEHVALLAAFNALEKKYRQSMDENSTLIERWRELKQAEVDELNAQNDSAIRNAQKVIQRQLAEASQVRLEDDSFAELDSPVNDRASAVCVGAIIPSRAKCHFEAHDGEILSLQFAPAGHRFATGGSDRRLKLWEITSGDSKPTTKATFSGCNQSVMCIDFDANESHILASSNDNAIRIWSISDQRVRHTFQGHTNKVHAARFLPDTTCVVSGSHDRSIKLWDMRQRSCTRSFFPGSICNDLVAGEGPGAMVITGHFDKKLRFWDMNAVEPIREIEMSDKVTSLQLSADRTFLLCSLRDDTLALLDLRMNRVTRTLTAEGLHYAYDFTRAAISPDDQYCSVGGADGSVYIWNSLSGKLEKSLKNHKSGVVAVQWSPSGDTMASVDRDHSVILWCDH